jgi:hypothetical protein
MPKFSLFARLLLPLRHSVYHRLTFLFVSLALLPVQKFSKQARMCEDKNNRMTERIKVLSRAALPSTFSIIKLGNRGESAKKLL